MTGRAGIAVVAFAIPALTWALAAALSRDYSRPNATLFTEMADSVAAETQGESGALPGGIVQQAPPEETVYRGQMVFPFGPGPEEAIRAGREWAMPPGLDADPARARRGATVFLSACSSCHGPGGLGNEALAAAGFPKPPALTGERARSMPDGQLYHILMHGQGAMAPHAAHVSPGDRWPVVLHVRKLQQGGGP